MASVPTALCDACVLYPAPVRDLGRLALMDLFRARWSEHIHREWIENLLRNRPDLSRDQLERTRALMDAHARDALVQGYETLIPQLRLPDPDDRHVLAAAVRARADVIVTYDLGHFPAADLAPYGVVARHPDVFVAGLVEQDAGGSAPPPAGTARRCAIPPSPWTSTSTRWRSTALPTRPHCCAGSLQGSDPAAGVRLACFPNLLYLANHTVILFSY